MSQPEGGSRRYPQAPLVKAVSTLFVHHGLEPDKADSVAACLVAADMMGHSTHGLALVPWYLQSLVSGAMARQGAPTVIADSGNCVAWKGNGLPGAWLIDQAIDLALERVVRHGVFTLTIAGSHHTGALATYLPRMTERGLMPILTCSGPAAAGVAPFGGTRGLYTPNPLAAGVPTKGDPILLDISASITTTNRARQLAARGERFPAPWVLDREGRPSDDPAVAISGGGTLLPLGGLDHGHKGYGLALLVESLTQGLSGLGRRAQPAGVLMNVFLQVIDPEFFGGREAFVAESSWLADACRDNPPRPGVTRVRVPGEQGAVLAREAALRGVPLSPQAAEGLAAALQACGLELPAAV